MATRHRRPDPRHRERATRRLAPLNLDQIAAHFRSRGPWKGRLPQLIDMLLALGRAEAEEQGYVGRR